MMTVSQKPTKALVEQMQAIDRNGAPPKDPRCLAISTELPRLTAKPVMLEHKTQPVQEWSPRRIHKWKSPLLMIIFFLIGLGVSVAHCAFYPSLKDMRVGSPDSQEEKLR
jgi:hypothetical protein